MFMGAVCSKAFVVSGLQLQGFPARGARIPVLLIPSAFVFCDEGGEPCAKDQRIPPLWGSMLESLSYETPTCTPRCKAHS